MRKIIEVFVIFSCFMGPHLSGHAEEIRGLQPSISINVLDKARLQRGASLFMNYCSGCHSLNYMRYNRMANDLGLTTFDGQIDNSLLKNNLIFTETPIHAPIEIAMPAEDAMQWFGVIPPDLSLSARSRGAVWLHDYLHGFYYDNTRPFKTNNVLIANVAMPDILGSNQRSSIEFDEAVLDLVTFLVYVGEPAQLIRYKLGLFVISFLFVFLVVVYMLKKSVWSRLN